MPRRIAAVCYPVLAALVLTSIVSSRALAEKQEEVHHLIWDAIDEVYHCAGSALDCAY